MVRLGRKMLYVARSSHRRQGETSVIKMRPMNARVTSHPSTETVGNLTLGRSMGEDPSPLHRYTAYSSHLAPTKKKSTRIVVTLVSCVECDTNSSPQYEFMSLRRSCTAIFISLPHRYPVVSLPPPPWLPSLIEIAVLSCGRPCAGNSGFFTTKWPHMTRRQQKCRYFRGST